MWPRFLSLVVGVAFGGLLHGGVIFSDFGPGQSYNASTGADVGSDTSVGNNLVSSAVSFTPTANSIFSAIDFAAYLVSGPSQLTVSLSSGALPGAPIESFSVPNVTAYPGSVFTVTSILEPELVEGTTYWVELEADDPVNSLMAWFLNSTGATPGFVQRFGSGPWFNETAFAPPVFDVQGTAAPEPSAFLLIGAPLLFFWTRQSRRAS